MSLCLLSVRCPDATIFKTQPNSFENIVACFNSPTNANKFAFSLPILKSLAGFKMWKWGMGRTSELMGELVTNFETIVSRPQPRQARQVTELSFDSCVPRPLFNSPPHSYKDKQKQPCRVAFCVFVEVGGIEPPSKTGGWCRLRMLVYFCSNTNSRFRPSIYKINKTTGSLVVLFQTSVTTVRYSILH